MITQEQLEQLRSVLTEGLAGIARFFKPGARLTLIVRRPDDTEADVIVTADDLDEVVDVIRRRQRGPNHEVR